MLDKLKALHGAATAGRLFVEPNEHEIRAHGHGKPVTTAIAPRKGGNRAYADMLLYAVAVNALPLLLECIKAAEAMADAIENPKCLGCGAFNEPCACAGSQRRAATNKYRAARAKLDEVLR